MNDLLLSLRMCCLVGLTIFSSTGNCAAHADPLSQQARDYRQVLFHYFQGDYDATLLAVAMAEHRSEGGKVSSDVTLLKGAASLSLGLHQEAQSIFNRLLAEQVDEATQAQAWFFLAKSAYQSNQRELVGLAAEKLSQTTLSAQLEVSQQYELFYLQGMLGLHNGQNTDIDGLLKKIPEGQIHRAYLSYNYAMLEARNGAYNSAIQALSATQSGLNIEPDERWFDFFSSRKGDVHLPEKQALSDKVVIAKGRLFLIQHKLPEAMAAFAELGQDAIDRDEALYHFANARYQHGDHQQALALWQHLKNSPSDTMRYPATFALATGLEEAGDAHQALENYQFIIDAVDSTLGRLNDLSQLLHNPGELEAFLSYQSADTYDWRYVLQQVFISGEHASDLRTFEVLKEQRRELAQLSQRINNLNVLMDERQVQREIRAQAIENGSYLQTLQSLEKRYKDLSEALTAGENDPSVFADTRQREWLNRLNKAYARADRLAISSDLNPDYLERLKRIKGILSWQLENTQVERSWLVESQLHETGEQIDRAKAQIARIKTLSGNNEDLGTQKRRVSQLEQRIDRQMQHSADRITAMENVLVGELQSMLASHRDQLQQYLYHSKLASLRLRDVSVSPDIPEQYSARESIAQGGEE